MKIKTKILAITLIALPLMANAQISGDSSMVAPRGSSTFTIPNMVQGGPSSERTTNQTGTNQADTNLQNQINALRSYVDGHFNNIYAALNSLSSQIAALSNQLNGMNDNFNREITIIRRVIDETSTGRDCAGNPPLNPPLKHGQMYNVRTGGGDDIYYYTLYQCFNGAAIRIGQNNMP